MVNTTGKTSTIVANLMLYWCNHIDGCRPTHVPAGTMNPSNADAHAVGVAPPPPEAISSTPSIVSFFICVARIMSTLTSAVALLSLYQWMTQIPEVPTDYENLGVVGELSLVVEN
jgi:hypothetical protein